MSLVIHATSARHKSDDPSSSIGQAANRQVVNAEALSRLLTLDLGELRQQWRGLYKTQACHVWTWGNRGVGVDSRWCCKVQRRRRSAGRVDTP